MDINEVMSNEIEDLERRLNFLQEVQSKERQDDDDGEENEPLWPTITNQM